MVASIIAAAAAFIGILLIAVGLSGRRGGRDVRGRLDRLESYTRPTSDGEPTSALRLRGSAWAGRVRSDLERAGIALTLREYMTVRILLALLALALVLVIGSARPLAFVIGIAFAGLGYMSPALYVKGRIGRQLRKLNDQLEEMITMLSNSLRAGFGLMQAFDLAAEQLQPPISTEIRRLLRDLRVGATVEEALAAMGERASSQDLNMIITAILIQRSVGSNLSEVLDKVAHTIRERVRLRGEVSTLTAQKRLSAWVLGLMPVAVVLIMTGMSSDYMDPLFTTATGRILLLVALGLNIGGFLSLRRIVSIEI
jgi:tight adherence protein B